MGGLFEKPKRPPPPKDEEAEERARLGRRLGRRGAGMNILTGGQGVTGDRALSSGPTLLAGGGV